MSHLVSSKCYVTDLDVCEQVAKGLGFDLVRNATSYKWYGSWQNDFSGQSAAVSAGHDPKTFGQCEHKLVRSDKAKGAYEIGLVKRLDGGPGWEALYDNWNTGGHAIESLAGRNLSKLKDGMIEEHTGRHFARMGYRPVRTIGADGAIYLTGIK